MKEKIKTRRELQLLCRKLKEEKKRIVFTNGCFDLLHYGHCYLLEKAKKLADILIVGLNSDGSVRKIKGKKRPIIPQSERAKMLASLEAVDFVTIFKEKTPLNLIKRLKPDVLVKGSDWKGKTVVGEEIVKGYKGKVVLIPLYKRYSTTKLIKRIVQRFK